MIGFGGSGGAGRGAGAGLVGEQAALDAVHQHRAKAAGSHLPQAERLGKDAPEDVGQQRRILEDEEDGEEEVRAGHDGHQHVEHLDGRIFAQHDDRSDGDQQDGGVQRRDAEGVLEGGGHGVADHLADAAPADEAGRREAHGEHRAPELPAAPSFRQGVQIAGGTAAGAAVERVQLLVQVGQRGLDERGGRAEQRRHPHPEHRARAAGGDRRDDADQIAHAHARGGGDDERLHAGEGGMAARPLFHGNPRHCGQQAHGQKARAEGEVCAGGHQQHDQQRKAQRAAARQGERDEIVPQQGVDGADQLDKYQNRRAQDS